MGGTGFGRLLLGANGSRQHERSSYKYEGSFFHGGLGVERRLYCLNCEAASRSAQMFSTELSPRRPAHGARRG